MTQISTRLRRSPDAIVARRRSLGIAPRRPASWTAREEALLRVAAAAGVPAPVVARSLGRSPDQVRARRRKLVGRTRPPARLYGRDEDDAIRGCASWNGDLIPLAQHLGRTPDALRLHHALNPARLAQLLGGRTAPCACGCACSGSVSQRRVRPITR